MFLVAYDSGEDVSQSLATLTVKELRSASTVCRPAVMD